MAAAETVRIDVSANVDDLRAQLEALDLDTRGNKETLKKRLTLQKRKLAVPQKKKKTKEEYLRDYHRQRKLVTIDYLLVIDFEATCWTDDEAEGKIQEIIEFPIVLVDVKARKIVTTFSRHVKPVQHPQLSAFCTTLTRITQDQVDAADTFPKVMQEARAWLQEHCKGFEPPIIEQTSDSLDALANEGLNSPRYAIRNWSLATDGKADMEVFLKYQLEASGLAVPKWTLGPYVDTRTTFSMCSKIGRVTLLQQLKHLGLEFEGVEHCGLDDARNIARVVLELVKRGATLHNNRYIEMRESGRIISRGTIFAANNSTIWKTVKS